MRAALRLRLQLIASDPVARALEYLNYLVFITVLLFAVAYYNYELGLVSVSIVLMQLVGRRWAGDAGVDVAVQTLRPRRAALVAEGSALAFISYLIADAAVYPVAGAAGSVSSFFGGLLALNVLPQGVVLPVGLLLAVQAGVSEPILFVQAVVNYFVSRSASGRLGAGGAFVGIFAAGMVFGLAHVPVDGFTIAIPTLVTSGIITAFAGLLTGLLSTVMVAHVLNNLAGVGLLLVLPPHVGMAVVLGNSLLILAWALLKSGAFALPALVIRSPLTGATVRLGRLATLSLLSAAALDVVSLPFPGVTSIAVRAAFPALGAAALFAALFAAYFLVMLAVGLFFVSIPFVWSLAVSLATVAVAAAVFSPEAAFASIFGLGLALAGRGRPAR